MSNSLRFAFSNRLSLFLFLILISGCSSDTKKPSQINTQSNIAPPATAIDRDSLFYGMSAKDSTTVFDLTVKNYAVEYDKMGDDYFVFSVNTVNQGDDYFWVYAVNDTMGNMAANKRKIGPGDRVVWHYRLITR
jgi:hypothetical protein